MKIYIVCPITQGDHKKLLSTEAPINVPVHVQMLYNHEQDSEVFVKHSYDGTPTGLIELSCGFTSHSTQNRSFRRRSPSQSLGLVWKKLNPTQQKHIFTSQKTCTTTQNKHKKLMPGLVASYDIRPENGEGLFLFWRFINLSLTHLRLIVTYLLKTLTHLLTAPGPTLSNINRKSYEAY